jgi:hypothetical protein
MSSTLPPSQLQQIREALKAGKVSPEKVSTEYAFQRAWNEGIEFAERQIDRIVGKPE